MAKVQLARAVTRHTGGATIDDEIQTALLRSTSDRQKEKKKALIRNSGEA